jgi:cyclopropane fatty-acyl-phospholipid synthase-like methyltransferase
MKTKTLYDDGT